MHDDGDGDDDDDDEYIKWLWCRASGPLSQSGFDTIFMLSRHLRKDSASCLCLSPLQLAEKRRRVQYVPA